MKCVYLITNERTKSFFDVNFKSRLQLMASLCSFSYRQSRIIFLKYENSKIRLRSFQREWRKCKNIPLKAHKPYTLIRKWHRKYVARRCIDVANGLSGALLQYTHTPQMWCLAEMDVSRNNFCSFFPHFISNWIGRDAIFSPFFSHKFLCRSVCISFCVSIRLILRRISIANYAPCTLNMYF